MDVPKEQEQAEQAKPSERLTTAKVKDPKKQEAGRMVGKKLLKMKPADLGRLDIEDSTKLVGTVALALWTQDMLVKQRIIPANIIKTN